MNLYAYVANNPLGYTDPTGMSSKALLYVFNSAVVDFSPLANYNSVTDLHEKYEAWETLEV